MFDEKLVRLVKEKSVDNFLVKNLLFLNIK